GDAGSGRAADRAHGALRHAAVRVQTRECAADELPLAALDASRARDGLRRRRGDPAPLLARDRRALPLLLLRRRDARVVRVRAASRADLDEVLSILSEAARRPAAAALGQWPDPFPAERAL